MAYETLIIEHEEPVLIIRLNRPNALNALNSKLLEELSNALTDADENDSVRTIILTCLLYTSPSPRDRTRSRMPSSA